MNAPRVTRDARPPRDAGGRSDTDLQAAPAPQHGPTRRRTTRLLNDTKLLGVLLILAILALWEVSVRAGWVDSISVPLFSGVLERWWELMQDGVLLTETWSTLWRMFVGYVLAIIVGVLLGLAMGYFRVMYNLLEPLTEILRPMPSPAYIPIVILFLGIQDSMKIFIIFFACLWPILLNTYSGVASVEPVRVNTARTFQLSHWQMLRKVIVPASAPLIFTGLRISLAIALIVAIISEMIASNDGLGHFILFSQRSFRVEEMFAGTITLGAVGYALNWLFVRLEHHVLRWHYGAVDKTPAGQR